MARRAIASLNTITAASILAIIQTFILVVDVAVIALLSVETLHVTVTAGWQATGCGAKISLDVVRVIASFTLTSLNKAITATSGLTP